jgi:hypothetical protein
MTDYQHQTVEVNNTPTNLLPIPNNFKSVRADIIVEGDPIRFTIDGKTIPDTLNSVGFNAIVFQLTDEEILNLRVISEGTSILQVNHSNKKDDTRYN